MGFVLWMHYSLTIQVIVAKKHSLLQKMTKTEGVFEQHIKYLKLMLKVVIGHKLKSTLNHNITYINISFLIQNKNLELNYAC